MTKIEKQMLIAVALCVLVFIAGVYSCNSQIENAGGIKQVIIDAGKEIKDIKQEIENPLQKTDKGYIL